LTTNAEAFFNTLATTAAIENLVGKSEDLYFDAKTVNSESFKADSDQGPLAKVISAFANSDGGVIIYGLEAKRDNEGRDVVVATKLIKDVELVCSRVLELVGQLLQPPVEGIVVQSRNDSIEGGYVLVFVPASDSGPHRARPQREYYRRHGSTSQPMEHYELEETFGRRKKPKLELYARVARRVGNRAEGFHALIVIGVKNTGRGLAKYPGICLRNCRAHGYGYDGNGNVGLPPLPTSHPEDLRYGASGERVVYPGVDFDITAIIHPLETITEKYQIVSIICPDLKIEYEIYAEDMPTVSGILVLSTEEILKVIRPIPF